MVAVSVGRVTGLAAALFALTALPTQVHAQGGRATLTGQVVSEAGQALAGANIGIQELAAGAVADVNGRYSFSVDIAKARGRAVTIVARYIGFKAQRATITLTPGTQTQNFTLAKDVFSLEQVVVTGTSGATMQKDAPFTVAVVDNSAIKEAPEASPIASLAGKIAGASVVSTSGQPGAEPAIRLRSPTSITGRQDPLIIVDGTITRLGLADINPEDIDRVEVIEGAAASSLYGSDAANGVIQIFTKRGQNLGEGQTSFTLRNEFGQDQLPKVLTGNMSNTYALNANGTFARDAGGNRIPNSDGISENPYPVTYDQLREVFRPGNFVTNYASLGERHGNTNLNASFQNTHDNGVLNLVHGYHRQNFRINVDQALTDNIDVGTGAFYGRSTADSPEATGIFFGLRFLEPNVRIDSIITNPASPFFGQYNPAVKQPPLSGNVANPLYVLQNQQTNDGRDRFTGTFRTAYRPTSWLTFEGNTGYDENSEDYKQYTPVGFANSSGDQNKGGLYEKTNANRSYNVNLTGTTNYTWGSVNNVTKLAYLYEDETDSWVSVNAPELTVPLVPEFGAAAQDPNSPVQPGSYTATIRARDAFLVSTFNIKDRYILDGLIRRDQSSLFGSANRSSNYERFSGAYRVTQDVHIPGVDELKLRASHGTAGLRPPFEAQYETFAIIAGSPSPVVLGNVNLRPAYSTENEVGLDATFLSNFTLEYSFSKKRTTDEIIKVPLSAATGYQFQWQNAGTLEGYSHEASLGWVIVAKGDRFLRFNFTADRTRSKITGLNTGPFQIGPTGSSSDNTAIFHIAAGEPLGIIYGSQWVRTPAQLAQTIASGHLSGTAANYQLNEEGYYVATSTYHTINEAPLKAYTCTGAGATLTAQCATSTAVVPIGDVNPDFNFGFNPTATWKSLSLQGTLTWVKGGDIYNYTRQWPFNELRDPVINQSNKPKPTCATDAYGENMPTAADPNCPYSTGRKPATYYTTFYNNFDPNSYFVEKGTYVRLRELSVSYQLPNKWAEAIPATNFHSARLGLVGRNLWTSTKYSGYDPDVTGPGGGNPFAFRVDYFTYPAYRTYSLMLELGF